MRYKELDIESNKQMETICKYALGFAMSVDGLPEGKEDTTGNADVYRIMLMTEIKSLDTKELPKYKEAWFDAEGGPCKEKHIKNAVKLARHLASVELDRRTGLWRN